MTRSSREPRRMWVAPGRRAARRSRLRVACNCFTIYSETHYKTKRKQNVRRFLEWRVSACVSRVAALGFCTFMHHGVLSRTQTKNVRLSFLRQEVVRHPPCGAGGAARRILHLRGLVGAIDVAPSSGGEHSANDGAEGRENWRRARLNGSRPNTSNAGAGLGREPHAEPKTGAHSRADQDVALTMARLLD